jgi:methylthioribulose-1-phosphate dehydratase
VLVWCVRPLCTVHCAGGISIRRGDEIYIAPSGVQKERMAAEDMFVMSVDGTRTLSSPPADKKFAASQCTPLFYNAFTMRGAWACIHTHSQAAVMATLLYGKEFRITHQEMIKGIRIGSSKHNLQYFDDLVVPIIDNTPQEMDLTSYGTPHRAVQCSAPAIC